MKDFDRDAHMMHYGKGFGFAESRTKCRAARRRANEIRANREKKRKAADREARRIMYKINSSRHRFGRHDIRSIDGCDSKAGLSDGSMDRGLVMECEVLK